MHSDVKSVSWSLDSAVGYPLSSLSSLTNPFSVRGMRGRRVILLTVWTQYRIADLMCNG